MDVSTVVMTIVSVTVGLLLVTSLLIPQAEQAMSELTAQNHGDWAKLIGVVVICSIISLVALSLYAYKLKD